MSIQPVSSTARARRPVPTPPPSAPSRSPAAQVAPAPLRDRPRRAIDLGPVTLVQPVAPIMEAAPDLSNSHGVFAELNQLMEDYANANAAKNKATRDEKKAKDALHSAMVKADVPKHSATVLVGADSLTLDASISAKEETEIDPEALLRYLGGDIAAFLKYVSVPKTKVEADLGKNTVIAVSRTLSKPAALSIEKAK